ncbi:hypothetical protein EYF80_024848 [Liparis tanakae]|uniref:Uncharacterized protein n=1 Tax=Liparis tanakae TaxID=230148 RepID=A0A4Z2HJ55_9TELE|nr:hypothetical protein EYF80_024848 [Liparis tanakae]
MGPELRAVPLHDDGRQTPTRSCGTGPAAGDTDGEETLKPPLPRKYGQIWFYVRVRAVFFKFFFFVFFFFFCRGSRIATERRLRRTRMPCGRRCHKGYIVIFTEMF